MGSNNKILLAYQCSYLFSSFFPHKLLFRTRSWFFEGEESKKGLGVKVTSKRIPGHFLKGFESRSAKEKEKCMRAAVGEQI